MTRLDICDPMMLIGSCAKVTLPCSPWTGNKEEW